VSIKFLQQTIL